MFGTESKAGDRYSSCVELVADAFKNHSTAHGVMLVWKYSQEGIGYRYFLELLIQGLSLYYEDDDNYLYGNIDLKKIVSSVQLPLREHSEEKPKEAIEFCFRLADLVDQDAHAERPLVKLACSIAEKAAPEMLRAALERLEKFDYHVDDISLRERLIKLVESDGAIDIERRIIVAENRLLRGDFINAKFYLQPVANIEPERVAHLMAKICLLWESFTEAKAWFELIPEDELTYRELRLIAKCFAQLGADKTAHQFYEKALDDLEKKYDELEFWDK